MKKVLLIYVGESTWMALVFSGLLLALSSAATIIPADRSFPWQGNVGVEGGVPDSSQMTVYTTLSAGASLASINSAISACPSNQVVVLSAGTYNLSGTITMKTGVVLQGAGMTNTVLVFSSGGIYVGGSSMYNALRSANYGGGGLANWTAGYAQGTSNLTFSTTSPGLTVGNIVYLDQSDDTFFVNNNGYEGNSGGARDSTHTLCQFTKVTAVNGNTVTVWPPIAATWFTSALNPGAVWIGASSWTSRVGIENLTIDGSASTGHGPYGANIDMECVHNCWIKGIKSINAHTSHVFFGYGSFRCELRDSYLYGTQAAAQMSYGITLDWGSSFLCENNVFERLVGAMLPHSCTGVNVFGYNFVTNEWYTASANFLMAGIQPHDPHTYMELFEGNHIPKYDGDFIHGSHSHEVLYRNRITGWEAYSYPSGPTTHNLQCEQIDLTNRYCSSVGNILGTAGQYSHYESVPTASLGYGINGVIYEIGIANPNYATVWPNDTNTASTFFRHMEYDVVTGGIKYNPTNADVTLIPSLYYTSKPSFFGSMPWPPFNPTNTTAAAIDPTNIPAGYWRVYGTYPPTGVINQPPVVRASAALTNGPAPVTVSFSSAGSYDPEGTSLSYAWVFGDGGTSAAANPSHTYLNPGSYSAHLSVSDGTNATASSSITINVTVAGTNQPPVVVGNANPVSGVAPLAVSFSSAGSYDPEGAALSYNWSFGDGATSASANPSHTYTAAGRYSAQLSVSDGTNTASSSILSITASAPSGGGHYYSTTFPLTENPISETNQWINGKAVGVDWGDVATSPGFAFSASPISVEYADPTAVLAGTWGSNQTVSAVVKIGTAPSGGSAEVELRLRSSISAHSCTGYEFNYSIFGQYAQIVRWNGPLGSFSYLGSSSPNGALATGDVLTATITNSSIYFYRNGSLLGTATDSTFTSGSPGMGFYPKSSTLDWGFSSFTASDGTTANQPPVAVATATPTSGGSPLTVAFSSAGSYDPEGAALTYSWAFGDGGTSTAANPNHTYQAAGVYNALLKVSDGKNTTSSSLLTITVESRPPAPTGLQFIGP